MVSSIDYPLLQIADGLSNFSYNYLKYILRASGNSSKTESMKHKVFWNFLQKANPDIKDVEIIKKSLQLKGDKIVGLSNSPAQALILRLM